jgi:hypothetical protein
MAHRDAVRVEPSTPSDKRELVSACRSDVAIYAAVSRCRETSLNLVNPSALESAVAYDRLVATVSPPARAVFEVGRIVKAYDDLLDATLYDVMLLRMAKEVRDGRFAVGALMSSCIPATIKRRAAL